jgi:hypothetical protein
VKAIAVLVVSLVLSVCTVRAHAEPSPRAAYVSRALAAVRALGAQCDVLDRQIYDAVRTSCHTPSPTCAIEQARAACKGDAACQAAADVILANQRSVSDFIDDVHRMRLVQGSADYHAALAAELRKRYAILAAELVLAGDGRDEGAAIDQMCRDRDRAIHACEDGAPACIPSLPWSRCVAAVVWFVGGSR